MSWVYCCQCLADKRRSETCLDNDEIALCRDSLKLGRIELLRRVKKQMIHPDKKVAWQAMGEAREVQIVLAICAVREQAESRSNEGTRKAEVQLILDYDTGLVRVEHIE